MDAGTPRRLLAGFLTRNKVTVVTAVLVAFVTSGTTLAASYLILGGTSSTTTTTTLKSSVNGSALSVQNTNSTGGTSAKGLSITVPAGRAPISVNSTAGKATNLNADKLDGIDSTGFVRGPVEGWHEVPTWVYPTVSADEFQCAYWIQPPLVCGVAWTNNGNGYDTAAYYKDPLGIVRLKGLVTDGPISTATVTCDALPIFTLPAGFRPAAKVIAASMSDNNPARIDIMPTGEVTVCTPLTIHANDWWVLDGITFRAAQ